MLTSRLIVRVSYSERVLVSRVVNSVKSNMKKTLNKAHTRETVMRNAAAAMKHELLAQKHVPRNSIKDAAKQCRLTLDLDEGFQEEQFQNKVGRGDNINIWRGVVAEMFDQAWSAQVTEHEYKDENDMPKKDKVPEPKIRVCSTTFMNILRPEFRGGGQDGEAHVTTSDAESLKEVDVLTGIIESCQDHVTDVIDELSILVEKTLLKVSYSHS
jgi:hypothetical protein